MESWIDSMLQYNVTVPPSSTCSLSLSSLFGIQIGADTSNNFALSINGLAVQTPDGRFVAREGDEDRLIDVTPLILPINPCVYRLPSTEVKRGDLIVTSDPPNFSALYVLDADDPDDIECLDTGTSQIVRYCAPRNLFLQFYVRAVSLLDLFVGKEP